MKRHLAVAVVTLCMVACVTPVLAWEFELAGEYEYRFRYFGRTGGTDLFGEAAIQEATGTFIGFAGPNIYGTGNLASVPGDQASFSNPALTTIALLFGPTIVPTNTSMVITRGGFSRWGSDARYNDSRLTLRPVFRLNPAVRVFGVYTVGGMRNKYKENDVHDLRFSGDFAGIRGDLGSFGLGAAPLSRYYMSQSSMNAYDGTFGTWEQFRLTATMPWGVWSVGMKDFPFGTGATLAYNTRAEEFLWVVPYGPFRVLAAFWLGRGIPPWESWSTVPDNDTKPNIFQGYALTYDSGELSAGALWIWRQYHQQRGALPIVSFANIGFNPFPGGNTIRYYNMPNNVPLATSATPSMDQNLLVNLLFFKFNNGRFFANAEYSWANVDIHFPTPVLTGLPGVAPVHVEANHFFSELGLYAGPAKLSLMYALASGPVLNGTNPTKSYFSFPINYQAMEPYEFLMFNTYAGGNSGGWTSSDLTFVSDEHGMMSDGYAFAGRLDYAVASNLNAYGSYIWAHRLERAGFLNGQVWDTGNGSQFVRGVLPGTPFLAQYGGLTPYVPDGYIGWEANVGVDWQLLEGLTFKTRYSYWQPGDWFAYAYQAWGRFPGGVATDGVIVKDRSPINAFQVSILANF
jgi:hypothetical protein